MLRRMSVNNHFEFSTIPLERYPYLYAFSGNRHSNRQYPSKWSCTPTKHGSQLHLSRQPTNTSEHTSLLLLLLLLHFLYSLVIIICVLSSFHFYFDFCIFPAHICWLWFSSSDTYAATYVSGRIFIFVAKSCAINQSFQFKLWLLLNFKPFRATEGHDWLSVWTKFFLYCWDQSSLVRGVVN